MALSYISDASSLLDVAIQAVFENMDLSKQSTYLNPRLIIWNTFMVLANQFHLIK